MVKLQVHIARSFWEKTTGLIGQKQPQALLFQTRFGIHTFGLKFPIDVIVLNTHGVVVSYKQRLRPNRLFWWNPLYSRVLELPEGTIHKEKITVGTSVELIYE